MPKVRNVASRRTGNSRAATSLRAERPATVKLDDTRLGLITALAVIDETTVAEQVRLAADSYIKLRLEDKELPSRVDAAVARFRQGFAPLVTGELDSDRAGASASAVPHRDVHSEKQVTLRLEQRAIDYCTSLALLDGTTLADQLRAGIDAYTKERLQDPVLERRIKDARQDQDDLLARLSQSA